jgi:tetratricopeptide (TPR) repeat protein
MGKKSKRNRGASKKQNGTTRVESRVSETSSAASDIAVVGGIEPIDSVLMKLEKEGDHEGILKLESDAIRHAKALEGTEPQMASYIYFKMARAFVITGLPSMVIARKKAIRYLERSFASAETDVTLHACVKPLVALYIQEGRHDEAFVIIKRLTVRIPQHELIEPNLILSMADELFQAFLYDRGIEILTMFLGTINRSWDNEKRAAAYLAFGRGYTFLFEYEKAASFFHKVLAITEDPEMKVVVLCEIGYLYKCSCNYDDALVILNQALEIISAESGGRRDKSTKSWSKYTALVHQSIGDVLSEQGKRDRKALESFERASVIMKEEDLGDAKELALLYKGIGVVHARLGNWDKAIDSLELAYSSIGPDTNAIHALLCEEIGRVRLDQYFLDERLHQNTQEREHVITEAAIFSNKSMTFGLYLNDAYLIAAQVAYLIAEIEEANKFLMKYFEAEMEKNVGVSCRSCVRKAGNGTDIKICRNCQVVDYCSDAHQALAWRRGRLSHKVMCPFLKRYRLVAKAENPIDTAESFEDISKDFFETVCVFKYEVK